MIQAVRQWTVERKLICQIPMIHFQHKQHGATLRATEVKPKLDRFLAGKCEIIPESWQTRKHSEQHCPLNYKLRLTALEPQSKHDCHPLFYGDIGDTEQMQQVKGDILLEILCMDPELRALIDAHIDEFFVVTNFGTMQNKGFGSYVTDRHLSHRKTVAWICASTGAPRCYCLSGYADGTKFNKYTGENRPYSAHDFMLDDIKNLYSAMKGRFLLRYFRESKQFLCEKDRLKAEGLVPVLGSNPPRDPHSEYRYVRALFGTCEQMTYIPRLLPNGKPDFKADRYSVKVSCEEIERFPSPVFFKVIDNTIYFAARQIHPAIYGKTFAFSTSKGTVELPAPEESDFDIHAFMTWFVEAYTEAQANRSERFLIRKRILIREVQVPV